MFKRKNSKVPKNVEYVPKPALTEKQKREKRVKIALIVTAVCVVLVVGIFFFSGRIFELLSRDKDSVLTGGKAFAGSGLDSDVEVLPNQDKVTVPSELTGEIVFKGVYTTGLYGQRTALVEISEGILEVRAGRSIGQYTVKSIGERSIVLTGPGADGTEQDTELTLDNTTLKIEPIQAAAAGEEGTP